MSRLTTRIARHSDIGLPETNDFKAGLRQGRIEAFQEARAILESRTAKAEPYWSRPEQYPNALERENERDCIDGPLRHLLCMELNQ